MLWPFTEHTDHRFMRFRNVNIYFGSRIEGYLMMTGVVGSIGIAAGGRCGLGWQRGFDSQDASPAVRFRGDEVPVRTLSSTARELVATFETLR
ncbi:MAG: hypothetical protein QGI88_05725 [SAR202 cluster bacterium]|jgi:hypothetical protein|nr:hypothetical protein [SAR202 cluster bacterium]